MRPGDSLTAIADRFGTTLPALARANKLDPEPRAADRDEADAAPPRPTRTTTDASPSEVRDLVDSWAGRYGVDPSLARALAWMESGYQTNLTSDAGAWGVMQIIPSAWSYVAGRADPEAGAANAGRQRPGRRRADPPAAAEFDGDERLAVGAWYQGARAVREHGLYPETKVFVDNVLALRTRV